MRRKAPSSRGWGFFWLALPSILLLVLFFTAPMLLLGRVSLYEGGGASGFGIGGGGFYKPDTWTLQNYWNLFGDKYFRDIWWFTVKLGLSVTLITLALAYPMALLIRALSPGLRRLALAAVILPKLANLLVVIYGLKLLLGNTGPVNGALLAVGLISEPLDLFHNLTGVIIGKVYLVLPYAVLVLIAALDRLDPTLVPAARGLGASAWSAFWRITFPLSLPGLSLAGMISLIWALGAFVSPYLLGSPEEITLAVDVQKQTFENINWPRGAADAVMMLVTLMACVLLYRVPAGLARRAGGAL